MCPTVPTIFWVSCRTTGRKEPNSLLRSEVAKCVFFAIINAMHVLLKSMDQEYGNLLRGDGKSLGKCPKDECLMPLVKKILMGRLMLPSAWLRHCAASRLQYPYLRSSCKIAKPLRQAPVFVRFRRFRHTHSRYVCVDLCGYRKLQPSEVEGKR